MKNVTPKSWLVIAICMAICMVLCVSIASAISHALAKNETQQSLADKENLLNNSQCIIPENATQAPPACLNLTSENGFDFNNTELIEKPVCTARDARLAISILSKQMEENIKLMKQPHKTVYSDHMDILLSQESLLILRGLANTIAQNLTDVAIRINASAQATILAEGMILSRSRIQHLLYGGDQIAAGSIEFQDQVYAELSAKLYDLSEACNCSQEIKTMIRNQAQSITRGNEHLKLLVEAERADQGILGWLFHR